MKTIVKKANDLKFHVVSLHVQYHKKQYSD
jgi:hypothetical protein